MAADHPELEYRELSDGVGDGNLPPARTVLTFNC